MLNVPYRFGGSTLRGIDCSAYVQRVFGLMDVPIPRTAREQYAVGERIGRDDIQVGDLVFFRTYASFPSHVGIYLGENLFIHASSMVRKVAIDSIDQPYYRKRFIGARRLVVDDARRRLHALAVADDLVRPSQVQRRRQPSADYTRASLPPVPPRLSHIDTRSPLSFC